MIDLQEMKGFEVCLAVRKDMVIDIARISPRMFHEPVLVIQWKVIKCVLHTDYTWSTHFYISF